MKMAIPADRHWWAGNLAGAVRAGLYLAPAPVISRYCVQGHAGARAVRRFELALFTPIGESKKPPSFSVLTAERRSAPWTRQ
jgi:hypothetical protein